MIGAAKLVIVECALAPTGVVDALAPIAPLAAIASDAMLRIGTSEA